jgi:hypothetical protein
MFVKTGDDGTITNIIEAEGLTEEEKKSIKEKVAEEKVVEADKSVNQGANK